MLLSDEEKAMLAGEMGEPLRWAMDHQVKVGAMFDAEDMVPVSQAHMMADPESLGEAGVGLLEELCRAGARACVPTITDPRGVDLERYRRLRQTDAMASLERRLVDACTAMGLLMTNTCINYQTIMAPMYGEHVAFGDTGVVIYANSVFGARSNFEGGPSAIAAGLTGRTPRYGLHLDRGRRATRRYRVRARPTSLTEWGLLGAYIGRDLGSYWEIPAIEGIEVAPGSDRIKHFAAAMASYGSTPLFHIVGITPEAPDLDSVGARSLPPVDIGDADLDELRSRFGSAGDPVDVVVFAAPQLSLLEMQQVAGLCNGRQLKVPLIVCTSPQVFVDAARMDLVDTIERAGGMVLEGTCFYNQFAREIGEANGWRRLLSNSVKIVNILGGYGFQPALAEMEACIESACQGKIVP